MDENKLNKIRQRILGKPQKRNEPERKSAMYTDGEVGTDEVIKYVLICAFSICSIYAIVDIFKRIISGQ